MNSKIRKYLSLSALFFLAGFLGAFLGKNFEKTKMGQSLEKSLGIKGTDEIKQKTAQGVDCIQQSQEKDSSDLFVGCNGFF